MNDIRIARRAFNAGEIARQAKWRNDADKHIFACERLENFLVSPLGGVKRRCGTFFLSYLGSRKELQDARLVPFEYNRDFSLVLCFYTKGQTVMLKYFDVHGIEKGDIETPLPIEALHEFQYKQINGMMYLAHQSMPPQSLTYSAEGEFSWAESVRFFPSLDQAEKNIQITIPTPSGIPEKGLITRGQKAEITSNEDFFTADMVGSQLKLDYRDTEEYRFAWEFKQGAGLTTPWYPVCGSIRLRPEGGVWDGILLLEETTDYGGNWVEIGRTSSIDGSSNVEIQRDVYSPDSLVRVHLSERKQAKDDNGCKFIIYTESSCLTWVKILSVKDARTAEVEFQNAARASVTTNAVYKSIWSKSFGFPRTVAIHEERLTYGGNIRNPVTVWLSQTNNWHNFRSISVLETDPLSYTLAADEGEPITWICSRQDMLIGTGISEWSLGTRDSQSALSAKVVQARNQSDDGAEHIMPTRAGNMLLYVKRGGQTMNAISYDFASDGYTSISLTTMAPHILKGGISCMFNQLSPDNRIYAVRNDGQIAVFTYDKENSVAAWARMIVGDEVLCACALSYRLHKSVFLIVRRQGYVCLERLDPEEGGCVNYLDCVPTDNGASIPEGLKTSVQYESLLRTTPIFVEGNNKVYSLRFYMLDSFGGKYRALGYDCNGDFSADDWQKINPREAEHPTDGPPRDYRFTGTCDTNCMEEAAVEISVTEATPFELCAIGAEIKAHR